MKTITTFWVFLTFSIILQNSNAFEAKLINGYIVDKSSYPAIVQITSTTPTQGKCTATIVGSKTLITAAHCADEGERVTFEVNGMNYTATAHPSELFNPDDEVNPTDHDVSILITNSEIQFFRPVNIRGKAFPGSQIQLFGYGCYSYDIETQLASFDGNLRTGFTTVSSTSTYDIISGNGAALCFGDSGGPAMVTNIDGTQSIVGINSRGNIKDFNINSRTDSQISQDYFWQIINKYNVSICGVNINC